MEQMEPFFQLPQKTAGVTIHKLLGSTFVREPIQFRSNFAGITILDGMCENGTYVKLLFNDYLRGGEGSKQQWLSISITNDLGDPITTTTIQQLIPVVLVS